MGDMKNSKVRKHLEEFFKMSFPEIVRTHFKIGMSRFDCAKFLNEKMGLNPKDPNDKKLAIKSSTVWYMVQRGLDPNIHQDDPRYKIDNFQFRGRTSGNPNYKSAVRKKREPKNVPITITYTCLKHHEKNVKKTFSKQILLEDPARIGLRGYRCPECHSFGSSVAEFEYKGKQVRKMVLTVDNALDECFVDGENNMIPNPFKTKKEKAMAGKE